MQHPVLGPLKLDNTTNWWVASVDMSSVEAKEVGLSADPSLEISIDLFLAFKNWLSQNYDKFIGMSVNFLFDFDLIWPENFIKNFDSLSRPEANKATIEVEKDLARKITINSVNVYDGSVKVWLDTGGYTTDHLVRVELDKNHKITDMEL